ncbi:MAG: metal ABC transporter ATP-binding protein [Persicimonas sp.]
MGILTTKKLVVGYDRPLIGPLDIEIEPGVFVLIEGPNGIGKSTLLKSLIGLLSPISGSYDWAVPRSQIRYVPQTRTLDVLLPATVDDVLATGFQRGSGWLGLRSSGSGKESQAALELVGMGEFRSHLFRELSEGQKQLVLLARAFLGDPSVVLLDEPAASMDPGRQRMAVELLAQQRDERGRTVFMIAHGSQAAREVADCVLQIDRSREVSLEANGLDPDKACCP